MGINVKKIIATVLVLVMLLAMALALASCAFKASSYDYDKEAVEGIKIDKVEYNDDSVVVYFDEFPYESIGKVRCFNSKFEEIEYNAQFSFDDNILTIETDNAKKVSGIYVKDSESDEEFYVRYLDSDEYAVIAFLWVDDIGYEIFGEVEEYYTQEEYWQIENQQALREEAMNSLFSMLEGIWTNESGSVQIIFSEPSSDLRLMQVNELVDGEWVETDSMDINVLSESLLEEGLCISIYDNINMGRKEDFLLLPDGESMSCDFSEELFTKAE